MALVNDNHKFIFFHLYKCGGMSLRKYINDNTTGFEEIHGGHSLPIDMKHQLEHDGFPDKFDEYFKFSFVRNPFDWMVSILFYAKKYSDHFMYDDVQQMNIEQFIPYYMDFRKKNILQKTEMFGRNRIVTIYDYLFYEDKLMVDFVGRVENMKDDLKYISEKIGIESGVMPFENVNPNREKDYRQYYNHASKKMIEDNFRRELDYFNYTF
jgi:hypothetical protein